MSDAIPMHFVLVSVPQWVAHYVACGSLFAGFAILYRNIVPKTHRSVITALLFAAAGIFVLYSGLLKFWSDPLVGGVATLLGCMIGGIAVGFFRKLRPAAWLSLILAAALSCVIWNEWYPAIRSAFLEGRVPIGYFEHLWSTAMIGFGAPAIIAFGALQLLKQPFNE